jgi:dolichol kinase
MVTTHSTAVAMPTIDPTAVAMGCRTRLQWGRKAMHLSTALIGLWLYVWVDADRVGMLWLVSAWLVLALGVEWGRRRSHGFNARLCRLFAPIMRERERLRITSATWYLVSMLPVFAVFPKAVAGLTLWFVGMGDTAAGIVGTLWGRRRLTPHISVEGCLATFAVCFVGAWLFASMMDAEAIGFGARMGFASTAAFIGTVAESVLNQFDDNLVIPLISAPALWGLTHLFF